MLQSSKQLFNQEDCLSVSYIYYFKPDMRSTIIIEKAWNKTLHKGLTNMSTSTHHSVLYTEAQSTLLNFQKLWCGLLFAHPYDMYIICKLYHHFCSSISDIRLCVCVYMYSHGQLTTLGLLSSY